MLSLKAIKVMKLSELNSAFPFHPVRLVPGECSETFQELTIVGDVIDKITQFPSPLYAWAEMNDNLSFYFTRDGSDMPPVRPNNLLTEISSINSALEDEEVVRAIIKVRKSDETCNLTIYVPDLINNYLAEQTVEDLLDDYTTIGGRLIVLPFAEFTRSRDSFLRGMKASKLWLPKDQTDQFAKSRNQTVLRQQLFSHSVTSRDHTLPTDFDSNLNTFLHPTMLTAAGYAVLTNLFHLTVDNPEISSLLVYTTSSSSKPIKIHYSKLSEDWLEDLYKIYYWVIESNNHLHSRISLARKVLSGALVSDSNSLRIDSSAFDQVLASYDLYMADYLSSFAEIRSQIVKETQSLSLRMTKINDDIASSVGKTLFLVVSAIASSILLKFVQIDPTDEISQIIDYRVITLGKLLVASALLYVVYEMINTYLTSERYLNSYKKLYRSLTSPAVSMKTQFENDLSQHISNERKYISKRLFIFGGIGLLMLSSIFVLLYFI